MSIEQGIRGNIEDAFVHIEMTERHLRLVKAGLTERMDREAQIALHVTLQSLLAAMQSVEKAIDLRGHIS
jgi:hypothetical protein